MNSTGILDDYLDELLGEAMVAPPPAVLPHAGAGQARRSKQSPNANRPGTTCRPK